MDYHRRKQPGGIICHGFFRFFWPKKWGRYKLALCYV